MRESRSKLYLSLLSLLVLLIPLTAFFYYYTDLLQETRERPVVRLVHDPYDDEPEEEKAPEPPAVENRELEVRGRACVRGGDALGDLKLTLGSQSVVSAADGSFFFPAAKRGRSMKLLLELAGDEVAVFEGVLVGDDPGATGARGSALELLPSRPARIDWTVQVSRDGAGEKKREGSRARGLSIGLGAVLVEGWGTGGRISVQGTSRLPPGAGIYSHLSFDGFRVAGCLDPAIVSGTGQWQGTVFLSPEHRWYSGSHELTASFNVVVEDPQMILEWEKKLGEGVLQDAGEISAQCGVFIGDPEVAEKEDSEVQAYALRMVNAARGYRDGLRSRVDEILRLGKGWDPALLSVRNGSRPGWFHESLVGEDGGFSEDLWRTYLDEQWRPGLSALLKEHREGHPGSESTVRKYQECYSRLEGLLSGIFQMSRVYSMFVVYPRFDLKPHEKDFYLDERGREDLTVLRRIVDEHFERLERFTALVGE